MEKINTSEMVKELNEKVTEFIKSGIAENKYKEMLDVLSKFHNYSANNCLLILAQCEDASHVASFSKWKKDFNRTVKKGEKAIRILAPCQVKRYAKEGEPSISRSEYEDLSDDEKALYQEFFYTKGFKAVPVFDITQTEGEDIPELLPFQLSNEIENFDELIAKLQTVVKDVPIRFEEKESEYQTMFGYFRPGDEKEIVIFKSNPHQMLKTAVHEVAHALLHSTGEFEQAAAEIQAESVAYVVLKTIGYPSDDYSLNYLASWCDLKEDVAEDYLNKGFEAIQRASQQITKALG